MRWVGLKEIEAIVKHDEWMYEWSKHWQAFRRY